MESVENKSYASSGVGNTALGLSIGALAVPALNGSLGNLFGGGNRPAPEPPATQRDLQYERDLTSKDGEIAQLKAQIYTDQQVLAAERRLADKISDLQTQVNTMNQTQAVLNAHQSDAIMMAQNEITRIKSVFAPYISGPTMAASEAVYAAFKPAAAAASATAAG